MLCSHNIDEHRTPHTTQISIPAVNLFCSQFRLNTVYKFPVFHFAFLGIGTVSDFNISFSWEYKDSGSTDVFLDVILLLLYFPGG